MDIEAEIIKIQERNKRVELDKAWETSNTRKVAIVVLTYLTMVLAMYVLKMDRPFVNAIIPTLGFALSTLSLSLIRHLWVKRLKEN